MAAEQTVNSVLVTGGCVFIGHHILAWIHDIEPTCRLSSVHVGNSHNQQLSSVQYYNCDITSEETIEEIMLKESPRVVIYTAYPPTMQENKKRFNARFQAVNVDGTRHADETLPILRAPVRNHIYTLTKADAEELVFAANEPSSSAAARPPGNELSSGERVGLLITVLRPCTTSGESDTAMFAKVLGVGVAGKARFQMGDGKNMYSFLYVKNLTHVHVLAAKALLHAAAVGPNTIPQSMRADGQAFHVTNDEEMPFRDFTRAVAAVAGLPIKPSEIVVIPKQLGMLVGTISEWLAWAISFGKRETNLSSEGIRFSRMTRTLSVERAKRVLGYIPLFTVQEGIERSVKWYQETKKVV